MVFHMYILESTSTGRFYIGHTGDVPHRLHEHNLGKVTSTRNRGLWKLFYTEEYATRAEASRREREIKQMKSHVWIEALARPSRSDREGR
jgi:putative endonuclease